MIDIKTAVAEIQNSFENESIRRILISMIKWNYGGSHGTETFLVQLKSSNQFYVAKCYDRSIYPA